jgi:hypothetical protein
MWSTSWFGVQYRLLLAAALPLSVALAQRIWTNVMHCYAERAPTPEVKKGGPLPVSSHKPPSVEQRPITFQNTQRPLPPTPEDNKLPEKPSSEYQPCKLWLQLFVLRGSLCAEIWFVLCYYIRHDHDRAKCPFKFPVSVQLYAQTACKEASEIQ